MHQQDYLGPTWVATSFFLGDDDGGAAPGRPDVAVMVRERDAARLAARSKVAALYLPGFLDSFFHTEQAAAFRTLGIPLMGLDMRRCGRSVRSRASRDDLRDIYVREEEIGVALDFLRGLGAERIVLVGHSTGGLQAALWAADHPGSIDALVLNSPWLDHNGPWLERVVLTKVIERVSARFPAAPVSLLSSRYARSLHVDYGGEFAFDPRHKPLHPTPVRAGFIRSVRRAQARVAAGKVRVGVPLLIAHSDASGRAKLPRAKDLASRDCVLGVEDMKRLGPALSDDVEFLEVPGGRHDLALSRQPARDLYTRGVTDWVGRTLGLR
ncbi:MAG: alpha/beta fold hydrolase [Actinomycetaceae bacterium]|nr:alpha/beta fold hydrolase [Actinomycetaceae bacterium]